MGNFQIQALNNVWTYFTPFSNVSIVGFEQVNVSWVSFLPLTHFLYSDISEKIQVHCFNVEGFIERLSNFFEIFESLEKKILTQTFLRLHYFKTVWRQMQLGNQFEVSICFPLSNQRHQQTGNLVKDLNTIFVKPPYVFISLYKVETKLFNNPFFFALRFVFNL